VTAVLRVLAPVALLASGLAAGVMVSTVIGITPLTRTLSYDRYVQTIQYLWPRYDPFMPALNGLTFVLDLVLVGVAGQTGARTLFGASAALLALVMAISVVRNVPINRYVMSLDPGSPPADWPATDPRVRWQNWNLLRTALVLSALVANVAAVGALL
jgi:uncharacterized membrane protein